MFNIKLGLNNMRQIMSRLGNPHNHPRIIHFTGTNGKGSTLVTIEKLLLTSGFTVGSTISPHLIKYNERFRINGHSISDEDLGQAFLSVCKACEIDVNQLENYSGEKNINPTFFEFSLAMAFVIFKLRQVDYVLLETGLGGRLDASNVVEHPIACVFTKIAIDHQEFLGDTLEGIAEEKLGILKPDAIAYIAEQEPHIKDQLKQRCREKGNRYLAASDNFKCQNNGDEIRFCLKPSTDPSSVQIPFPTDMSFNELGLTGSHQLENIATALSVYFSTVSGDSQLAKEAIAECIRDLEWPGRLQYLDKQRKILLDGAHNASGMDTLVDYLKEHHADDKMLFVISWMEGKEIFPALDYSFFSNHHFLPLKIEMTETEHIEMITNKLKSKNYLALRPCMTSEFVESRLEEYVDNYDLIVIAGSLYLIGEFLSLYHKKYPSSSL